MSDNKKELLNEAQIRQFMKLAQLQPLSNAFINEATPADPQELEELRTGRTGALGPPDGTANPGHGRGQGEAASGALFEEEDVDELEGEMAHDLGDDSLEGDEEAAGDELEIDAELGDEEGAGARVVDVDEFLSALEVALENVLGDEVEIDSDEVEDVEDVALDVDVEDVDVEDEVELQEGDEEDLTEEEGSKKREFKRRGKSAKHPVGHKAGDVGGHYKAFETNESAEANEDLVEQITKRVAARILKAALSKK